MKIKSIINAAALAFNVPASEIVGGRNARYLAWPRQAVMLLARWEGFSAPRIGMALKRHHTTVLHGSRAAERRAEVDEEYGDQLQMAYINAFAARRLAK